MFATRFWSTNYEDGIQTLFNKLNQGCIENEELLNIAKLRSDAESAHAAKLRQIAKSSHPKPKGFGRDDGASMRLAFDGVLLQLENESQQHDHIASSLKQMVLEPFSKWSQAHQNRIQNSYQQLQTLLKRYQTDLDLMTRAQNRYFNRCRLEEDHQEEEESSDSGEGSVAPTSPTSEELVLSGVHYTAEESQMLLKRMLNEIPQSKTQVKILGTYEHTVSGQQLTNWLMENTKATTLDLAEIAGQLLVQKNFLRLVGQIGSRFVNSSVFWYQWKPHAYEFAGMSPEVSTFADVAERWARNTVQKDLNEETFSVKELDQKYRKSVDALENSRLELEAAIVEHLQYLEKCEIERLNAFKSVLLDFSASVSNVVPALSAGVDKLLLFHETASVDRDLRFLVENYQTGKYAPRVFVYDNYYSSSDGSSVFGQDLELRARADKKKVPQIVSMVLSTLDLKYPKMDNDNERLGIWQRPLHLDLRLAQNARQKLNSTSDQRAALDELSPLALVQALRLYFLELPVSVVGGQLYEILKGVYTRYQDDDDARLQALQNTLGQLTISHIATLDAFTAHLHRLVSIANAGKEDLNAIAGEWGDVLCRPKSESMLAINDAFPALIVKDLLNDRERVFGELKRQQSRQVSRRLTPETTNTQRRDSTPVEQQIEKLAIDKISSPEFADARETTLE